LANAADWLGESDAESVLHHDSGAAGSLHETFIRYLQYFRAVTPDLKVTFHGELLLQQSAIKRALELRRQG